jgi:hypothetical protein
MSIYLHDWTGSARCREIGVHAFYAEENGSNNYTAARVVCQGCPVRALCLDTAMRAEADLPVMERAGMWGGLTPQERRDLHETSAGAAA